MTAAACPAIFYVDSAFCITFWQNIAIFDVRSTIDAPHMRMVERAYQTLASRFSGGIVSCVVVQPGTPVSPPDALKACARLMRDLGPALTRVAIVIEDVGVAAQVFRTVARGINVVIRDNKLMTFDDLSAAVDALAPFIVPARGEMKIIPSLTAVLLSARARYATMPPPPRLASFHEPPASWPSLRG
jgi:hypothetical protein